MTKDKKVFLVLIVLLVVFSGCMADNTNTQTPAEAYLASHSQDEILAYFEQSYLFFAEFDEPNEIPVENLFRFVLFHDRDSWYDDEKRLYYIPLVDIYETLDGYLYDYEFCLDELANDYAYDSENESFVLGAIGMGTGCTAHAFYDAKVIDADNIKVTLLLYSDDPEVTTVVNDVYITAKIVDGEPKFTSYRTAMSDVDYDSITNR